MFDPSCWVGPPAGSGATTPTASATTTSWWTACPAPSAAPGPRPLRPRPPADNRIVVSLSWPRSGFILLLAMGLGWLTVQPVAASDGAVLSGPLEIRIIGANGQRRFVAPLPEATPAAAAPLNQVGAVVDG